MANEAGKTWTRLTVTNHDRDQAGLTYVYPVLSRRSGGISVGINLNPNQACNYRCIYCQVPNLTRGVAPSIDLDLFEHELDGFLHAQGASNASTPPIQDVAFSGDGEPTTCKRFDEVVARLGLVLDRHGLLGTLPVVVISNGTMMDRPEVQRGLQAIAAMKGELWFKIDGGSEARRRLINDSRVGDEKLLDLLETAARCCPVRIQSCMFKLDGQEPSPQDCEDYLAVLEAARERGIALRGISLYGIARESHQPEATRLSRLSQAWFDHFAEEIEARGFSVRVHR